MLSPIHIGCFWFKFARSNSAFAVKSTISASKAGFGLSKDAILFFRQFDSKVLKDATHLLLSHFTVFEQLGREECNRDLLQSEVHIGALYHFLQYFVWD